jgi:hypothetical protein
MQFFSINSFYCRKQETKYLMLYFLVSFNVVLFVEHKVCMKVHKVREKLGFMESKGKVGIQDYLPESRYMETEKIGSHKNTPAEGLHCENCA